MEYINSIHGDGVGAWSRGDLKKFDVCSLGQTFEEEKRKKDYGIPS